MSGKIALAAALLVCSLAVHDSIAQDDDPFHGPERRRAQVTDVGTDEAKGEPVDFENILKRPVKVNFVDTPLTDVVEFFAGHFDINIQLDHKGLSDAAIDPSVLVTLTLRKPIPFESALRLILGAFDLTFVVQDDVLKITSIEKADDILTTKVYFVGDLITTPRSRELNWGPLMNMITSTLQPDSWDDNGGPGSMQPYQASKAMVIAQKRDVHEELKSLFAALRAESKEHQGTAQAAAKEPFTRLYKLGNTSGEQCADAIKKFIAPSTWQESGGSGEIRVLSLRPTKTGDKETPGEDLLLVRQSPDVHQEIYDVFVQALSKDIASILPMPGVKFWEEVARDHPEPE